MATTAVVTSAPLASEGDTPRTYTRAEVAGHKTPTDCWIIIQGKVYNVTQWLRKHPGGKRIIQHYAGEDATVSIIATEIMGGAHYKLH